MQVLTGTRHLGHQTAGAILFLGTLPSPGHQLRNRITRGKIEREKKVHN